MAKTIFLYLHLILLTFYQLISWVFLLIIQRLQLYINPEECIDCGACEPECPVEAIFDEDDTPDEWKEYIKLNYDYFGVEMD